MLTQSQYDLLCPFLSAPIRFEDGLPEQFAILEQHGYIAPSAFGSSEGQYCFPVEWSITPLGVEYKERFEKHRADEAQNKSQQRFQNKVSIAAILVPFITFILGILFEHFVGAVNALVLFIHASP